MALTDYIQIEYIESDGQAYINLGTDGRPTRNWSIYARVQMPTNATYYIWGLSDGSHYYDLGFNLSQNAYLWRCATSANRYIATGTPFNYNQIIVLDQFRSNDTSDPTVMTISDWPDETTSYSDSKSYPSAASATKNLYLFARNNNGTLANVAPAGTRMYSFEAINWLGNPGDQNRFEMVPIREKNGTRVGLYNTVTDTAHWAAVSNFIAGPDIGSASKLWIRQSGSWNSGTPYIRQSGSWTAGTPYIRQSGSWNQGS